MARPPDWDSGERRCTRRCSVSVFSVPRTERGSPTYRRELLLRPIHGVGAQRGGTVTLFAFDEGQSLSEHTAPFDAIAHVLEGEAGINIANVPLTVRAGGMVLMPANQPHAVNAATRFKMLLTMIRSA